MASLRAYLATQLEEDVVDIGYIEPGHGMKGRQVWLLESDDLISMYTLFKNKKEIILWCHIQKCQADGSADVEKQARKKSASDSDQAPPSKRGTCAQKLSAVEEIVKKLKDRHGTTYSVEKLNVWAHMLHIERHDSYEVPPNVPYFNRSRPALQDKSNLQTSTIASPCR